MAILLNVPFSEKDEAKKLGAWWNPELKKWYVKDRNEYIKLKKWISPRDSFFVVCDHLYIIQGENTCFKCGQKTRVIGYGIESYMEFDYALFRQFTVMANKPFYRLIFNSLRGVYHKIGLLFFSDEKHRQVTHDFYVELRDICEKGQSDLVVECIRKHKQVTSAYWRAILESLPKDLATE